jgi:hypothetical protein
LPNANGRRVSHLIAGIIRDGVMKDGRGNHGIGPFA